MLSRPHSYSQAIYDGTPRGPRGASAWPSDMALIAAGMSDSGTLKS